jgi:hypothetical protein
MTDDGEEESADMIIALAGLEEITQSLQQRRAE